MTKSTLIELKKEGDINLSPFREEWHATLPDQNKRSVEEDAELFVHQSLSTPCLNVIKRAKGATFTTLDDQEIIDFHGNNVHQVGYGNETVIKAIIKQLKTLPFSPRRYTNPIAINLAKKLIEIAPKELNRVLFAPGGTAANSMALKLARIKTGKHKVISMWGSFHGAALDTISVGGEAVFRKGIGTLLSGTVHVPPPMSYRGLWTDDCEQNRYIEYIRYVMEQEGDIGALMAETIRDTDVQLPTIHFWKQVKSLCEEFDVLLILDEIPIALGRTGKMFAFENYGIVPDMVTIGKGLGGGIVPFAALLVSEELNCAHNQSIGHFTHEKSPIGCAAALATIQVIEEQQVLAKVFNDSLYLQQRFDAMQQQFSIIGDVRGIGMLWGLELVTDRKKKTPAYNEAEQILYQCLNKGVNFKVSSGNVLTLSPSLTIERKQLDKALSILEEVFMEIEECNATTNRINP